MTLTDTARRRMTLAIFLLAGPLLLVATGWMVSARRGNGAAEVESQQLSRDLGLGVSIARVDYLWPGEKILRGVAFSEYPDSDAFFFAPEIRVIQRRDSGGIRLAERIASLAAAVSDTPNTSDTLDTPDVLNRRDPPLLAVDEILTDAIASRVEFWEIPLVIRRSKGRIFFDSPRASTQSPHAESANPQKKSSAIVLRIGRLERWDSAAFDQKRGEFLPPRHRAAPVEMFPSTAGPRGNVEASESAIAERVDLFLRDKHGGVFTDIDAVWGNSPRGRIFCAATDPLKIGSVESAPLLFWGHRTEADGSRGETFFRLDTFEQPFPTVALTDLAPIFGTFGPNSWFQGRIDAEVLRESPQGRGLAWRWGFSGLEISHGDLAEGGRSGSPPPLTGTLRRLFFETGKIENGIFTGTGEIHLVGGRLDKSILVRLGEKLGLLFTPENTLANRFDQNQVPFDQLQLKFAFRPDGLSIASAYENGAIGAYRGKEFAWTLFLPHDSAPHALPYSTFLAAVLGGDHPYWTPEYRDAMNHLPVPAAIPDAPQ